MTTINIDQIKPASDAVQAADKAMKDANNQIAHLERETPRNTDKIGYLEKKKADARQRYEVALIALAETTHKLIARAESE